LILFLAWSQPPQNLVLSGGISGNYTAKTIELDHAFSVRELTLSSGLCDDQLIPGIAVLLDSCIRDQEWNETYAGVLVDSTSFHSPEAMLLYNSFLICAHDDCGIDSFFVKSMHILPPGGIDRPGTSTREFRITFRAVDFVGRAKEQEMIWIRKEGGCI